MSATVYDLIGQIINPSPGAQAPVQPRAAASPSEPVHVLIGRILAGPAVDRPALRAEPAARPQRAVEIPAVAV